MCKALAMWTWGLEERDPQNLGQPKCWADVVASSLVLMLGSQGQEVPGSSWIARISEYTYFGFKYDTMPQYLKWSTIVDDTLCQYMSSTGTGTCVYMYTSASVHIITLTHMQICIHKTYMCIYKKKNMWLKFRFYIIYCKKLKVILIIYH